VVMISGMDSKCDKYEELISRVGKNFKHDLTF